MIEPGLDPEEQLLARLPRSERESVPGICCSRLFCPCYSLWDEVPAGTPSVDGVLQWESEPPLLVVGARCPCCREKVLACGECMTTGRLEGLTCPWCGWRREEA